MRNFFKETMAITLGIGLGNILSDFLRLWIGL